MIARISVPDSPMGIDAKYTHAIVIDFLKRNSARRDRTEERLESQSG